MLGLNVGLPRIRVRDTLCVRVTRKACNCSESVRYVGIVLLLSFCEATKNLQPLPRRGSDTERGVFAMQLTETEQLQRPRAD